MNPLRVGLIGVGNMGKPMALRLLEQGVDLTVCDRNPEALQELQRLGAKVAASPLEVANACSIVIASMPSREASLDVALGEFGVVKGKEICVYIETSTIGSSTIESIASRLRDDGVGMIDAPVSGGPPGARAGTLAILASGAEDDFELGKPVLEKLAAKLFYLGAKPGVSQVAKVINNHISAAGRLAVFEGLAMGIKAGLDPKVLNDVFNAGSARNYTTTDKVPAAILTGTFKFNGPLTIGLKDEALLLEEAQRCGAPTWIAPRILELYEEAAAAGYRDEDSMKVFLYMQSQSLRNTEELNGGKQ
ncbi:3-hydroxyisobutyrate dehydrogenase [Caballeronia catudaia]|uniref:3-hydroxyisobutyrate dehydrogenase n=2 Tax=Caballeronia catudaia TaxID=1777136 RepID=A0A158CSN9_9BURK|nr:3-hydroxyisobutyrate dehydrogenase [Caballeronia catudaia]